MPLKKIYAIKNFIFSIILLHKLNIYFIQKITSYSRNKISLINFIIYMTKFLLEYIFNTNCSF